MALAVPTAFARVDVRWFCEGRVCGFTAAFCCCEAPVGRDARCATAANDDAGASSDGSGADLCPSECDCRMVIGAPEEATASLSAPAAPNHPSLAAVLPSARPVIPAPPVRPCAVRPTEARGPPAAASFAGSPVSPRAPPFSP